MKKLFTFLSLLLVSVGTWAGYYTVASPYDTQGGMYTSTVVYGPISSNEQFYTDALDVYEVAAFVGDECRAVATPTPSKTNDEWTLSLRVPTKNAASATADAGKPITFKIYNARSGKEFTLNTSSAVTWQADGTSRVIFSLTVATGVTLGEIKMNLNETVDLMNYLTVTPQGASLPLNQSITWSLGNFVSFGTINGNMLTANQSTENDPISYGVTIGNLGAWGNLYIYAPATSIRIEDPTEVTFRIGEDNDALNELLSTSLDNPHFTVTPSYTTDYVRWEIVDGTSVAQSETGGYILKEKGTTHVRPVVVHRDGTELRPSTVITINVVQPVTSISFHWVSQDFHNMANVGDDVYARLASRVRILPTTANNQRYTFNVMLPTGGPAGDAVTQTTNSLVFNEPGLYGVQVVSEDNPQLTSTMLFEVENPAKEVNIAQDELNIMYDQNNESFTAIVKRAIMSNISLGPQDYSTAGGSITATGDAVTLNQQGTMISDNGVFVSLSAAGEGTSTVTVTVRWNNYDNFDGTVESITTSSASKSFTVTIASALQKFVVTHTPWTGGGTLVFIPVPATAAYNPDDVYITLSMDDYPSDWTTVSISSRSDNNGIITVNYLAELPGTISVLATDGPLPSPGSANSEFQDVVLAYTLVDGSILDNETRFTGFTVPATYDFQSGWQWRSNSYGDLGNQFNEFFNDSFLKHFAEARTQSVVLINDAEWGLFSDGDFTLSQGQCYKIKMNTSTGTQLTYGYFDGDDHHIDLHEGWTWVGSPYVYDRQLTNALPMTGATLANETLIVSKTGGSAVWDAANHKWTGNLTKIEKNQGYLVYSPTAGQTLSFAAEEDMAQGDESVAGARSARASVWSYDASQFANNMSMIAEMKDVADLDNYTVGAFVNGECRGEGVAVDGRLFITVHGNSGEQVTFRLHNELTGEYFDVPETVMSQQMLGTLGAPVRLTAPAVITGINEAIVSDRSAAGSSTSEVYDLMGRQNPNAKLTIRRMADGKMHKVVK